MIPMRQWTLLITGVALSAIAVLFIGFHLPRDASYATLISATDTKLPIRLRIPTINVDAPIDQMGVTQDGAMEAPSGPRNVGWFKFGAIPGDAGSAVIAGHYGWKNGIQVSFDNLNKLKKGDKIYVENDNAEVITFVVRELRTYGKDELAPEVFSSNDGKAHLNLVTCEGTYDKQAKSYSKRLVVFADVLPSSN